MQTLISKISFKANKMPVKQAQYTDYKLKQAKNVDIICHNMTDRDSANSALSIWNYLNSIGINSRVIISQNNPETLELRTYEFDMVQAKDEKKMSEINPDIVFCVDFGSENKVSQNVLKHISKCENVMGFDHHREVDIARGNYFRFKKPVKDEQIISACADFYSDMSAKSATSVVYRFFEALGKDIDNSTAYDLFLGLVDDAIKRNLVKCDGIKGVIEEQEELVNDKNAYEIYIALKEKLTGEQISSIAKATDVLSCLTPEQQAFKDSLEKRLKFSENRKIAYIEISPDDEEWKKLGGDNIVTSRILNNFRQEVLSKNDEVEVAISFYEAHGNYRLSAHSKQPKLLEFFKYIEDNKISEFGKNSGGHEDRAGGKIISNDPEVCHKWATDIILCDNFFHE